MAKEKIGITWQEGLKMESGKIVADWYDGGLRFMIMRGPASFNAYAGVPVDHPLAGHEYDLLPVQAHGGLTYSCEGSDEKGHFPAGYWWYGWDYAHAGDKSFHEERFKGSGLYAKDDKEWTPDMIKEDSWRAFYDFEALLKLAEAIRGKKK